MQRRASRFSAVVGWMIMMAMLSTACSSPPAVQVDSSVMQADSGVVPAAVALAAGNRHAIVIRNDLTVWSWGQDGDGQLGNGLQIDATAPAQVEGLSDIRGVAGGHEHTLVLKVDGTVAAVGGNHYGQLGNGTLDSSLTFVAVSNLAEVKMIAAKGHHSYAVKKDGTVWGWGVDAQGKAGITTPERFAPDTLASVQTVASGLFHAAAVKSDGALWIWGANNHGELGVGATAPIDGGVPVQVKGPGGSGTLTDVVAVACGFQHTLAVRGDGTVWAWGANGFGQLGDGTLEGRAAPTQVAGVSQAKLVAAGYGHSLAVTAEGHVYAWGLNDVGQLGNGEMGFDDAGVEIYKASPSLVPGLQSVAAIAAGSTFTVVVLEDGSVRAWGENASGQLGDGTTVDSASPRDVSGFTR